MIMRYPLFPSGPDRLPGILCFLLLFIPLPAGCDREGLLRKDLRRDGQDLSAAVKKRAAGRLPRFIIIGCQLPGKGLTILLGRGIG